MPADNARSHDTHSLNTELLVVLRDFDTDQLQGQPPNSHLDDWLQEVADAPEDSPLQAENSVRASIKQLFRKRNCLTMARPAGRKTTNVTATALSPDFMDDLDAVKTFIWDNIQPLKANDAELGGPAFAQLVESSVQLVNDGTPLLLTRLGTLARDFNLKLSKACISAYVQKKEEMGMAADLQMLGKYHEDAKQAAVLKLRAVRLYTYSTMTIVTLSRE